MESRPKNPSGFNYVSDSSDPINADSVLLEFKYDRRSGSVDASSYRNVFRIGMPVFDHPIKQMAFFGPYLYVAHGDGSVQSATAGGGQNNDALGKILRIDPVQSFGEPYTVPRSNPFIGSSSYPDEVYAVGFRNPHHLCFGRDRTLYVAETGRDNVEEVNLVVSGGNYGWSDREGTFVHEDGGGLINGISDLPADDEKFGFIYPAAQVGHEGSVGAGFVGQAIAGGCPVENGSPMSGNYYYSDFPRSGKLFYSGISELRNAKTTGPPQSLTQARTRQAKIFFEQNGGVKEFDTLGDVVRFETGVDKGRVDVRFGRGAAGELYWSSKTNGGLYVFTSSMRRGPGGPV
ncbi:Six-bladed beta-propeller TolB-like protein [Gracilaria domingensis]|nr:Six-bladed beta-propeller TolB-like protein [Gracilaria domingensis]